ncbi:MAG: hypothetical protein M1830_007765 [Pleopsidium flavum]|nr:MAG: hypothetical protein M1830_007765 [Pleopsidium flavum]
MSAGEVGTTLKVRKSIPNDSAFGSFTHLFRPANVACDWELTSDTEDWGTFEVSTPRSGRCKGARPDSVYPSRFTEWAQQYGGMYSLKVGTATAVVLTDRRLIKNLIDGKSSIYSNRPPSYVMNDLTTRGDHLLVMDYGNTWRLFRRILHQKFMESKCEKEHVKLQNAEAGQMLRDFCIAPEQHMLHPKRYSNSIIMSLVFGIRTPSYETHHLTSLYNMMEKWSEVGETGATPPVDIFPFLKCIPERFLGNWISRSRAVGKQMEALYGEMLDRVIRRRFEDGNQGSLIDNVLDQQKKLNLNRNQLKFLGGVLMEGGSDTASSMLLAFIHAMVKWENVQKKAQREMDSVIDQDRTPVWSDYSKLPYVSMIIKEVMRWRPVTPLSFPHYLSEDDWVDGRFLPKGTTILINVWGLHHDETIFPDPDTFDPERYSKRTLLAPEYATSADYESRDHYGYGAGRRLCPGIHLAERNLFLGVSKLLWAFSFAPSVDELGNVIPPDVDSKTAYTQGFLHCPKPFGCTIKARSEARRATVMREFKEAEAEVFSKYES